MCVKNSDYMSLLFVLMHLLSHPFRRWYVSQMGPTFLDGLMLFGALGWVR